MADALIAPSITAKLVKFQVPTDQTLERARAEADEIVAEARQAGEEIVAAANAKANDILADTERRAQIMADRRVAERLVEVNAGVAADIADMRVMLADMLRDGLEKIIGEVAGPNVLARLLDRAVAAIGQAASIEIRVNPDDLPGISEHFAAIRRAEVVPDIRVEPDAGVETGSAVLSAGSLRTRVALADQLDIFERLLRGDFAQ